MAGGLRPAGLELLVTGFPFSTPLGPRGPESRMGIKGSRPVSSGNASFLSPFVGIVLMPVSAEGRTSHFLLVPAPPSACSLGRK